MTAIHRPDPELVKMAKASRISRAKNSFETAVRENLPKWYPAIREWRDEQRKQLAAGFRRLGDSIITTGNVDQLMDWGKFTVWSKNHFKPLEMQMLILGGKRVFDHRIAKQDGFDPMTAIAVEWLNEHCLDLVNDLTAQSKEAVANLITAGTGAGKSPAVIAREIREYVGMTGVDAIAVANREVWLIQNRPELGPAGIKKATEVYARKKIRQRAIRIARTETAFGLNEGVRQGYGQIGYKKLQRIEDPECCEICAEHHMEVYTIEDAEGVLPEHPNCEGTWVAHE